MHPRLGGISEPRSFGRGTVQFVEHSIRRTRINLATMV